MCLNATQATSMPPVADVEPGSFEISYIYLSTSGLILTLVLSNVASLVCPPPTQNQRRPVLYSRLIWHISFFSKHWSEEAVDDSDLDAHNKCDKIALIESNCVESSVPSGDWEELLWRTTISLLPRKSNFVKRRSKRMRRKMNQSELSPTFSNCDP